MLLTHRQAVLGLVSVIDTTPYGTHRQTMPHYTDGHACFVVEIIGAFAFSFFPHVSDVGEEFII